MLSMAETVVSMVEPNAVTSSRVGAAHSIARVLVHGLVRVGGADQLAEAVVGVQDHGECQSRITRIRDGVGRCFRRG